MANSITLLALFEDIDPAANAIEKLNDLGLADDQITVISGVPISTRVLGRPRVRTNVSRIGMAGAILGLFVGVFLIYGIPYLYPLHVGGQPVFPIPPGLIVTFEMTMLGLMGFAFLGVFVESRFPSYEPVEYVPEVSDGKIAVFFKCPKDRQDEFEEAMREVGAESVEPKEEQKI
jgi:Alternative complex III, ActD subunit